MSTRTKAYTHTTGLKPEELKLASQLPMHEDISKKLQGQLEATDLELKESKKYFIASVVFIVISTVGIFISNILWIFGFLGFLAMWFFGQRAMAKVPKRMGFVDGIFYMQYHYAKELSQFEKDLKSDDSDIPKEVREAIANVKAVNDKLKE